MRNRALLRFAIIVPLNIHMEDTMARNKANAASSARSAGTGNGQAGADKAVPVRPSAHDEDAPVSPVDTAIKACEGMLEMQQQWLRTASARAEDLSEQWKSLQRSGNPMEMLSAQCAIVNQQFETAGKQLLAVWQQMLDAQLQWMGQATDTQEAAPAAEAAPAVADSTLSALTRVQDEWLQAGRNWIDAMQSAKAP